MFLFIFIFNLFIFYNNSAFVSCPMLLRDNTQRKSKVKHKILLKCLANFNYFYFKNPFIFIFLRISSIYTMSFDPVFPLPPQSPKRISFPTSWTLILSPPCPICTANIYGFSTIHYSLGSQAGTTFQMKTELSFP